MSHADPLFAQLRMLRVDDLYTQCVRIFSFKMSRNMLPAGVSLHINKVSHQYKTRGAINNLLVEHSDPKSIRYIASGIWNTLPLSLKQCPSIASFKEQSKGGFLASYASFVCSVPHCRSCAVLV